MQSTEFAHDFVEPSGAVTLRSLSVLRPGERAQVQHVQHCSHELRVRLLSMGLVSGQIIEVLHLAPLGDPMTIRILGTELGLRLSEAAHILVAPLGA